jgi:hypothetical protein
MSVALSPAVAVPAPILRMAKSIAEGRAVEPGATTSASRCAAGVSHLAVGLAATSARLVTMSRLR